MTCQQVFLFAWQSLVSTCCLTLFSISLFTIQLTRHDTENNVSVIHYYRTDWGVLSEFFQLRSIFDENWPVRLYFEFMKAISLLIIKYWDINLDVNNAWYFMNWRSWMPCSMSVAKSNWVRLLSHFTNFYVNMAENLCKNLALWQDWTEKRS